MRSVFRHWLFLPVLVFTLVASTETIRLRRIQQLTTSPEWSVDAPVPQRAAATGYAHGARALIVPDHTGQSQQWIAQTQQMLEGGWWRLRRVDYDNAPHGRETHLPGLYRCWLALLASVHGLLTQTPPGLAVEQVALYADPLLQVWFVFLTAWFVHRHFGSFAGAAVAISLVTVYPLATVFIPGAPETQGLAEMCALWSVLPLAAAVWARTREDAAVQPDVASLFLGAGVAGGLGLWLSPAAQLPVLAGIALGGLVCARTAAGADLPWRSWALAGAVVSLGGYMAEYFPAHLALRLEFNHPLYALAWLAGGDLLHRLDGWIRRHPARPARREVLLGGGLLLGLLALVALALSQGANPFTADLTASRLTRLNGGFTAAHLGRWLSVEGISARTLATLLPATLLLAACGSVFARSPSTARRAALALALGPAAVTLALAGWGLRWWNTFEGVGLVALAVATATTRNAAVSGRWRWGTGVAAAAGLGLLQLLPARVAFRADEFSPVEMQALVERDLAHWLARRHPGAIVLAPPDLTTSLWFNGGLRGITTFDPDNRAGFVGALRIAAALTHQEALTLLQSRGVTHIVLPAWDRGLDEAARESSASPRSLFIEQLRGWILPRWLRPIAYFAPGIGGFDSSSVAVFEVVDEQSEPVLVSQMATCFVESGLPGHATELRPFVRRYPTDLGALVSLAEIEIARQDVAAFRVALEAVVAAFAAGADDTLAWDRRIALAAVLARGERGDLARAQIERCCAQADEAGLRSLSARSLFRFLALLKNHGLELPDRRLQELALQLLPPESRPRLQ